MFPSNRIQTESPLLFVPAFFLALAWLIPNHYPPWVAAWGDASGIFGLLLLLAVLLAKVPSGTSVSWQLLCVAAIGSLMPIAQFISGKLLFSGDALMATFYIALWLDAVIAGRILAATSVQFDGLSVLSTGWLFAALISVGISLVQWTGTLSLGIYGVDLPPGARPFANLAQPNNFSTACFLGLSGLLFLYQSKKVNDAVFWLGCSFLLLGMVLSQSRTGWLQISLVIACGLAMKKRANLRVSRGQLLAMGMIFSASATLFPLGSESLLLSGGRTLSEQMRPGVRLPYWEAMIDAIGREPLSGYGWLQVGAAQQRIALDHPSFGDFFEHAHNIVLDILLWNGVPVGSFIIVVLAWWFITHISACRDARAAWLLVSIGGVVIHGMLELPLEYAYFLIPVGLAMGAVDGFIPLRGSVLRVPRWTVLSFTGLLAATFLLVAVEYLKAEENYRTLRMESARIGVTSIVTPAPGLQLLTQLDAFLQFARTEAKPSMTAKQVEWMRKVSARFGYPSVMLRYALAAGLNGQTEIAWQTLDRLCRIHPDERCIEDWQSWAALQTQYPQLARVVAPSE